MTSSQISEKDLDKALADALQTSEAFLAWFVSRTKFAPRAAAFLSCRSDHPWGTHPFVEIDPISGERRETTRQSETDVLLILKANDGETLGVHIENKVGAGRFTANQPQMYKYRAEHWLGNSHYGGYTDFDTVLVAPQGFRDRNHDQIKYFGTFIAHEEIAHHIPDFAVAD